MIGSCGEAGGGTAFHIGMKGLHQRAERYIPETPEIRMDLDGELRAWEAWAWAAVSGGKEMCFVDYALDLACMSSHKE